MWILALPSPLSYYSDWRYNAIWVGTFPTAHQAIAHLRTYTPPGVPVMRASGDKFFESDSARRMLQRAPLARRKIERSGRMWLLIEFT